MPSSFLCSPLHLTPFLRCRINLLHPVSTKFGAYRELSSLLGWKFTRLSIFSERDRGPAFDFVVIIPPGWLPPLCAHRSCAFRSMESEVEPSLTPGTSCNESQNMMCYVSFSSLQYLGTSHFPFIPFLRFSI